MSDDECFEDYGDGGVADELLMGSMSINPNRIGEG